MLASFPGLSHRLREFWVDMHLCFASSVKGTTDAHYRQHVDYYCHLQVMRLCDVKEADKGMQKAQRSPGAKPTTP